MKPHVFGVMNRPERSNLCTYSCSMFLQPMFKSLNLTVGKEQTLRSTDSNLQGLSSFIQMLFSISFVRLKHAIYVKCLLDWNIDLGVIHVPPVWLISKPLSNIYQIWSYIKKDFILTINTNICIKLYRTISYILWTSMFW